MRGLYRAEVFMVVRLVVLVLVVGAAACGAASRDREAGSDGATGFTDAAGALDAAAPVTCGDLLCDQIPGPRCVDGVEYIAAAACQDATCTYPETPHECSVAGCCDDHCCVPEVSNAGDYGPIVATGLVKTVPSGVTFDTHSECTPDALLGQCAQVTAGSDGLNACVCHVDDITIGDLRVTGDLALVILARRSITLEGLLDLSATGPLYGPGLRYSFADLGVSGGAGGSHGTLGGYSGGGLPPNGVYGNDTLIPLMGGTQGQDAPGALGGGGGGGVQLSAGERIAGIYSQIDVSGGGGGGGPIGLPGAGGGSAGGVLIEAPAVHLGIIYATGGGGGAGGSNRRAGPPGGDGEINAGDGGDPDDDHGCALGGYTSGGWGGDGVGNGGVTNGGPYDSVTSCFDAERIYQGGGGGATGRIRINSTTSCEGCSSTVPAATYGTLRVR